MESLKKTKITYLGIKEKGMGGGGREGVIM